MARKKLRDDYSSRDLRKIEILEKYYTVDKENKIITVPVHFDTASELFDAHAGTKEHPLFNQEVVGGVDEICANFPNGYKGKFDVTVDDFENHEPDEVATAAKDLFELSYYRLYRIDRKNWLKAGMLMFLGIAILSILNIMQAGGVFGETITGNIFDYVIDTAACAVVWEAFSLLFYLYPTDFSVTYHGVFSHFDSFALYNKDGTLIKDYKHEEIVADWIEETKKKKSGRILLLIASIIFFSAGVIDLVTIFPMIKSAVEAKNALGWSILGLSVVTCVFELLVGAGAIARFLEKKYFHGWDNAAAIILASTTLVVLATYIVAINSGAEFTASNFFTIGLVLFASIFYFIGAGLTKKKDSSRSFKLNKKK